MQFLYRFAADADIENAETISFKKRSRLLDGIKSKNEKAWGVINNFIDTQLNEERIKADEEKQKKNLAVWETELALAKEKRITAGEQLEKFCVDKGISLEGLVIS